MLLGEKIYTKDRRELIFTKDLANGFIRVINEDGKLEVIHESILKESNHGMD